jgi:hypothetical protein
MNAIPEKIYLQVHGADKDDLTAEELKEFAPMGDAVERRSVVVIVHWLGQDVPACAEHALKMKAAAGALDFSLSIDVVAFDEELKCSSCEREATKAKVLSLRMSYREAQAAEKKE